MIGGNENVATCAGHEGRSNTDGVESHLATAFEMRWPLRQGAGDQRVQVIEA